MSENKHQSNKKNSWFKHWLPWVILLVMLNIYAIFLIADGALDDLFGKPEPTEAGTEATQESTSETTAEEATTEESTEAEESTEVKPSFPEGVVDVYERDDSEEWYFRNWYLSFFFIPEELGNTCSVSVKIPKLSDQNGSRTANVDLRFQKEDQNYRYRGCELVWEESLFGGKTAWLDDIRQQIVSPSLEKVDAAEGEENSQTTHLMQISATLSQEIYPAGEMLSRRENLWDGILEEVGFWWTGQTGQIYGTIKGDIYIMNDDPRECWICLDKPTGLMPVKLVLSSGGECIKSNGQLSYIRDVDFESEKDKALAKLSFDLTVEELGYPEGSVKIDNYEQKMTYFRNWMMSMFYIPDRLSDSCEITYKLEELNGYREGWDTYVRSNHEISFEPRFYKDGKWYKAYSGSFYWDEGFSKYSEQITRYLDGMYHVLVERRLALVAGADDQYDSFYKYYLQISGLLSQEISPEGLKHENQYDGWKEDLWRGKLEAAGFWHQQQTGECFGTIKGDIYLIDLSDSTGAFWICLEGMAPIKVKPESTDFLSEALTPIEGADFEAEKDKALAKLSFDLTVEALNKN